MEQLVAACLQTAALGEATRGGGGVVFVEGEELAYLTREEMGPARFPPAFADKLHQMMEDDGARHFFVVHKDDLNLHVSKIPKLGTRDERPLKLALQGPDTGPRALLQ